MKNMTGFGNAFVLPLVCLARIEKPRGKRALQLLSARISGCVKVALQGIPSIAN
jgi:hypothetical protein